MNQPVRFDPSKFAIGVGRDFSARTIAERPDPQIPVDGATFGVATMHENSPHNGERHPDGDEVLYLISGKVRVVFVDGDHDDIDVSPGEGLLVPKGVWHRVDILEPCQIVCVTPGPNNQFRAIDRSV